VYDMRDTTKKKVQNGAIALIELARCQLLRETQWSYHEPD